MPTGNEREDAAERAYEAARDRVRSEDAPPPVEIDYDTTSASVERMRERSDRTLREQTGRGG